MTIDRRVFLGISSAAVLLAGGGGALARRLGATPRQTEGPFYPDEFPVDTDANLLRIRSGAPRAEGTPLYLSGRVLDRGGRPIAGARVEIWQCDNNGHYIHSRDGGLSGPGRDRNFQGYGRALADDDGRYRFLTIRPVPYPGRTPHIHFKVAARGHTDLTTQMYVAGEPLNRRDGILNGIRDAEERARLLVALHPAPEHEPGALKGGFDIVLRS